MEPTNDSQKVDQEVLLTFEVEDYRAVFTAKVFSDLIGLDLIEAAVFVIFEALDYTEYVGENYARILMRNDSGEILVCEDQAGHCEEWLKNMLVSAEILND